MVLVMIKGGDTNGLGGVRTANVCLLISTCPDVLTCMTSSEVESIKKSKGKKGLQCHD